MELKEKAAYLKGLAEGLDYDKTTAEGKLIAALIDIVDALAGEIEGTQEDVNYLSEYIEEIDQDLGNVEEELYGDEEDDEEDEDFEPGEIFGMNDFEDEEDEETPEDKEN